MNVKVVTVVTTRVCVSVHGAFNSCLFNVCTSLALQISCLDPLSGYPWKILTPSFITYGRLAPTKYSASVISVQNIETYAYYILHEIRKWKANWIGHISRRNCLLKQVIEGKRWNWQKDEEEDIRNYWMTLRKGKDTFTWRRKLHIALCGGIVLKEALNLSSDRILNEWMVNFSSAEIGFNIS
jgi:hypothetical protein